MSMDIATLLRLKPESLAAEQEQALRLYTTNRLHEIGKLIAGGEYKQAHSFLACSPAGDDHGSENYYISFEGLGIGDKRWGTDLGTVLDKLMELQAIAKKGKEW